MKAWHFVRDNKTIQYKHNNKIVKIKKGLILKCDPEQLELCHFGLHASTNILDALSYSPGKILCRVELGGAIVKSDDKLVASERKILWWIDIESILHEFSCWCAERALKKAKVTDKRCWNAIYAKRRWIKHQINDNELSAAWSAAWSAARSAAESAAESAAWSAARSAAWSAARSAARSAAWSAARSAAWYAAWSAEKKSQSRKLLRLINAASKAK